MLPGVAYGLQIGQVFRMVRRLRETLLAVAVARSAGAHAATAQPEVMLDRTETFDRAEAWVEALQPRDGSTFAADDRLELGALVLERPEAGPPWPTGLTLIRDEVEATVSVPATRRRSRTLTLRFLKPWKGSLVVVRGSEIGGPSGMRIHPVLAREVRGDPFNSAVASANESGADFREFAAILEHATEPTFAGLGRVWSSLHPSAKLTFLDRLGASRCVHGVSFLTRVLLDGGEEGARAERSLGTCGARASLDLTLRFESASPDHRVRLAPLLARTDPARAFGPLLEATSHASGPTRSALRGALTIAAHRLSSGLVDARLGDAASPLRVRLALAAAAPSAGHEAALAAVAREALSTPSAEDRRRGVWIARDLPVPARAALRDPLVEGASHDLHSALRAVAIEAAWPIANDEERARFLADPSPTARAVSAGLAKEGGHTSLAPAVRAGLESERWLESTRAFADALATLAPTGETIDLLRLRGASAADPALASLFLEARAVAHDVEVLGDAKKFVRRDAAPLELRVAGVRVYRLMHARSLNGDLVRLAKRALDPLAEDDLPLAYACLEALAELATADDRQALAPLLEARDPGVRLAARRVVQGRTSP